MALQNGNPRLCFLPGLSTGAGILVGLSGRKSGLTKVLGSLFGLVIKSSSDVCFFWVLEL